MTVFDCLARWRENQKITPEQAVLFDSLIRQEPFSVFLELNVLLYTGVIAFVGGLGWVLHEYAIQLGAQAIVLGLTGLWAACLVYCFRNAEPFTPQAARTINLIYDYVLYLGCLVWSVQLGYLQTRYHWFADQKNSLILLTALWFFFLAYRFDNRFVLSMALVALAGWFGIQINHPLMMDMNPYRHTAVVYGVLLIVVGLGLQRAQVKPHFTDTFFNFAANFIFLAILSGVFSIGGVSPWSIALLMASVVSCVYGIRRSEFLYVAYAAVYGYLGLTSVLIRPIHGFTGTLLYLIGSGLGMITGLTVLARRIGREA